MNNLPLPPLPEPINESVPMDAEFDVFSVLQLEAYAREAQAIALEAAAKVAETIRMSEPHAGFITCADAIRALQAKP
jgi:hypothetical protein